jgi:hypothetical protein
MSKQVVMFAGNNGSERNDTWTWDEMNGNSVARPSYLLLAETSRWHMTQIESNWFSLADYWGFKFRWRTI